MRKATLTRIESTNEGTFSRIVTDSGFNCFAGELPERENQIGISCLPTGIYQCTWRRSRKHGMCYHLENIPGRTDVEIHAANFMGDKSLGFKCELQGCIAPGKNLGRINGQRAIISSKSGLLDLEADLGCETFELTIVGTKETHGA